MTTAQPQAEARPRERTLLTLEKGLAVLEAIATLGGSRGVTANELGRNLSLNRSTLYRFLATLQASGYVSQQDSTDRYTLGFRVLDLCASFLSGLELRVVANPFLEDLNRATGETVHVVALDRGEVVTIDRLEGTRPYSLHMSIGARRPAYCTASGKAIIAHLAGDTLGHILSAGMRAYTGKTITSPEQLGDELRKVRRFGFAIDDEEYMEGVRCAAAPIFDYSRRVVGGVSLASHASHTSLDMITKLGGQVREAARRISQRLGYTPNPSGESHERIDVTAALEDRSGVDGPRAPEGSVS